jgi:tetratricopeptide (TPR) repeat protein
MANSGGAREIEWQQAMAQADECRQKAQYDRSASLYEAASKMAEEFGPQDVRLGRSLNRLGHLISFLHSSLAAEPTLRRALLILDQHLPPDDPEVTECLTDLVAAYFIHGNHASAEPLQKRLLSLWEKAAGLANGEIAALTLNLGTTLRKQGKHAEAEQIFQRWLSSAEKLFAPNRPDIIRMLQQLADLYTEQGKHDAAEPLLRRLLAEALGAEESSKPEIARRLHHLALNQSNMGRDAEAEDCFRRSINQDEQIRVIEDFARFLRRAGRAAEAENLSARVKDMWDRYDRTH